MPTSTYESKRIGTVKVITDGAYITIETKRLRFYSLNQLKKTHLIESYRALLSDNENVTFYCAGNVWTDSQIEELVSSGQKNWKEDCPYGTFAVYTRESNVFIGHLTTCSKINDYASVGEGHENVTEIGYILNKQSWGFGYGTEMAVVGKKQIKHAIDKLCNEGVQNTPKEIVATVHPSNIPSKRILEKTLKQESGEVFPKFGNPRLLFFKPLKQKNTTDKVATLHSEISFSNRECVSEHAL